MKSNRTNLNKMIREICKLWILLLPSVICVTWNDNLPWIEKVDIDLSIPIGAENISTTDHVGTIVCLFHLISTYRPAKPGLSDITFNPSQNFDGSLCTHVICTRLTITHNIELHRNREYDNLNVVKELREKYPNTKFLLDVTVLPGGVYNYIGQPQFQDFKPFDSPTNLDALDNNRQIFVDLIKGTVVEHGFHGVHVNQAFYNEDSNRKKLKYRAVIKALKSKLEPENLLLTSDILFQDGKISDVNEMFDLVMVDPAGRNNEELANFFFSSTNFLHGNNIRRKNNFVLQIYMYGFLGAFSTQYVNVSRTYVNDLWGYNELCQIAQDKNNGMEMFWDVRNEVAILTNGSSGVIMPTPKSVAKKAAFVVEAGLRGVMIRSNPEDDFTPYCAKIKYPLSRSVNYAMFNMQNRTAEKFCYYKYQNLFKNPSIILPDKKKNNIMYALVNTSIELKCEGIGSNRIKLSWAELNGTLTGAKVLNHSKIVAAKDPDCPLNVSKSHNIWISLSKPGHQTFECTISNEEGHDSNKITVITRPKPYRLLGNSIIVEEVDLDLNFVLLPGETYLPSEEEDPILLCQLNLFETALEMHKFIETANGLKACTHLVLSGGYWLCDDNAGCPSGYTREQIGQIMYIREKFSLFPVLMGISIRSNYTREWRNNSVLPALPRGLKMDGIHLQIEHGNFYGFIQQVKALRRLTSDRKELLTASLKFSRDLMARSKLKDFASHVDLAVIDLISRTSQRQTQHNSPLNSAGRDDSVSTSIQLMLETYRIRNVVLGLSTSGFSYQLSDASAMDYFGLHNTTIGQPTRIGYNQICNIIKTEGWRMFWDHHAQMHFLKKGSTWISFESLHSIYAKLFYHYGANVSPRGIMLASVELDDFKGSQECGTISLLEFIQKMMRLPRASRNLLPTSGSMTFVEIGIASLLVLILMILLPALFVKFYRNKYPYLTREDLERFEHGDIQNHITKGETIKDVDDMSFTEDNYIRIPCRQELIVSRSDYDIDFKNVLGSGQFGMVLGGTLWGQKVAVKTLAEAEEISRSCLLSLLNEIKLMMYLGSHPNIVELLGCDMKGIQKGQVYLFLEFCPMGNLLNFLRINSSNFKKHPLPETRSYNNIPASKTVTDFDDLTLLVWCYQITHGLGYLSQKKIIHGDMAARNVLLVNINHIKITDFGLSKRLQENYAIYKKTTPTLLPWRWLSPEALNELNFSTRSDVWALGVTMWEIYSMGAVPYPGLGWDISFTERIIEGLRLQRPPSINGEMFQILEKCWLLQPEARPDPKTIQNQIRNLVDKHENRIYSNIAKGCYDILKG